MTNDDPELPRDSWPRDTLPRIAGDRIFRLAAVALIVGVVVLVVLQRDDDKDTRTASAPEPAPPAAPGATVRLPPPDPGGPVPTEGVIAQGTAANGVGWRLSIDETPGEGCLTVALVGGQATACTGASSSAAAPPADEAYLPILHGDEGGPRFVFGRMPTGVTEVEVILGDGGSLGRVPVARGAGGPYYAAEVTGGSNPIAVFGYVTDGTSVRFDLPR